MNNLLTEVSRIQEIIGISKKSLNEGVIGNLFTTVAEKEITQIIRKEVAAALKQGVKASKVYTTETAEKIEKEVMEKAGLKSLTGAQKAGLKSEALRMAKFRADKAND